MLGFLYKIGRMNSNLKGSSPHHLLPTPHSASQSPSPIHSPQFTPIRPLVSLLSHDRPMYSSTIQLQSSAVVGSGGGAGGLQGLGRMVGEEGETAESPVKENYLRSTALQQKPLAFRTDRNPKTKMAASSIFLHAQTPNSHSHVWHPASKALANDTIEKQAGLRGGQQSGERVEEQNVSGGEGGRKRQILALKREVQVLSNRFEHTLASTEKKDGGERRYFQLARRNQQPSSQPFLTLPTQQPVTSHNGTAPQHYEPNYESIKPPACQQIVMPYHPNSDPTQGQTNGVFKKKNVYLNHDLTIHQHQQPKLLIAPHLQIPNQQPTKPLLSINCAPLPRQFRKTDFAIGRRMGKGQFGQVMMVIHRATGFLCGMKVMSKRQIREEKYAGQIARELSIQFYLTHRFIAPLYGYFQDEENVYLLVEFCTDGQLLQRLRQAHRLEEVETSSILREVCEGLDYIHREQIIHRDVKPENILFQMGTAKISDFGWAVFADNGMRRTVSGTPLYYSPELVLQSEYDEKVDVWAVGLMAYECLIGRVPFRIYSEFDLGRIVSDEIAFPEYVDLTPDAKDFILRALNKKAEERLEIRDMLRHPFIAKHRPRGAEEGVVELRKLLGN